MSRSSKLKVLSVSELKFYEFCLAIEILKRIIISGLYSMLCINTELLKWV